MRWPPLREREGRQRRAASSEATGGADSATATFERATSVASMLACSAAIDRFDLPQLDQRTNQYLGELKRQF